MKTRWVLKSLRISSSRSGILEQSQFHTLYLFGHYLRPRDGRQALHNIVGEILRGEVAVLEKSAGLDLDIANRTQFLN